MSANVTVNFTGWESDEFLTCANWVRDRAIGARVEVVGREPILATPVHLVGVPLRGEWAGYRRVLVIQTDDGTVYEVGGSNASRPIASTTVRFTWDSAEAAQRWGRGRVIEVLMDGSAQDMEVLPYVVRTDRLDHDALHGLVAWGHGTLDQLRPEQIVALIRVVGVLPSIETVALLSACLSHEDYAVIQQAALRLRGMEPVFKIYPLDHSVMTLAIDRLARAVVELDDAHSRVYSAEDLGYFQDHAAIQRLISALQSDPVADVRWACAVALGRTSAPGLLATLLDSAEREPEHSVVRGCMLGISRVIPEAAQQLDRTGIRRAASLALNILDDDARRSGLGDAAAALIGELARPGSFDLLPGGWFGDVALERLADGLTAPDMPTRSASAYAIGRYVGVGKVPVPILERVEVAASVPSDDEERTWPDSAYHQWYLAEMGELLSRLESHALASRIFASAASSSSARPWSAEYFQALDRYEHGESLLPDQIEQAMRCFGEAEQVLGHVLARIEAGREDEDTISGLRLRRILAASRAFTLRGVIAAMAPGPGVDGWRRAEQQFSQAVQVLSQIDVLELEVTTTRRLSPSEAALVTGLLTVSQIGLLACRFHRISRETVDVEQRVLLMMDFESDLEESLVALSHHASTTHSKGFRALSDRLAVSAEPILESCRARRTIGVGLLRNLLAELVQSLPRPGMCPLLASGHASMTVTAQALGDGTAEFPFMFTVGESMVLDVTVAVGRRGRSETLKFSVVEPGPEAHGTEQFVPVHDNTFSLKPVVLGVGHLSQAIVPTVLRLTFQTEACQVVAHELVIYHHCVAPDATHRPSDEAILSLERSIARDQTQLEKLARADEGVDVAGPMRMLEVRIQKQRADLARLREGP